MDTHNNVDDNEDRNVDTHNNVEDNEDRNVDTLATMLTTMKIEMCGHECFGEGSYGEKRHNCEVKIMG